MGTYLFEPMDICSAREIADTWKYHPPYDFYDVTADIDDYEEFIDPRRWPDLFFTVHAEEELCGFFSLHPCGDLMELGLGMRPNLVGRGMGVSFVSSCLRYAVDTCGVTRPIVLKVASFNERAIKVYERVGFEVFRTCMQETNGSAFEFVEMRVK